MHSIRTFLLILICFLTIGVYFILVGSSEYYINSIIVKDSSATMNAIIEQKAMELNLQFNGVERAVDALDALDEYIRKSVDIYSLNSDKDYLGTFISELTVRASSAAKMLGNVSAVYLRMNPYEYGSTSGIFLTEDGYGDYISVIPTDILQYEEKDREHVGWYYEPVESGHAIWMEPYYNKNIDVKMVSYVSPIYIEGKLFGIVGMDINMSAIHSVVDSVEYADGNGFLADAGGNLIYHKDYPDGLKVVKFNDEQRDMGKYLTKEKADTDEIWDISWNNESYRMALASLENGMIIAVSVPRAGLAKPLDNMRYVMLILLLVIVMLLLIIMWRVKVRIIRPIQELTAASAQIAKGEMNVPIEYKSKDEIGKLANSVRSMKKELQDYFAYIHRQAYTDVMTGVGNKTAYFELIHTMDRKINEGMAEFVVIIFDINGLKNINDNYGHECGDILITDAADVLKQIFGAEHIFRIGGDEFIIVLEHRDEDDVRDYFSRYEDILTEFNNEEHAYKTSLSISKGYALYVKNQDYEYKEVFKRADASMYKDKEEYYRGRNDRRKR